MGTLARDFMQQRNAADKERLRLRSKKRAQELRREKQQGLADVDTVKLPTPYPIDPWP